MMMLGPIQVYTRHPNSLKEREYLSVRWRDGKLTVTYVRHDRQTVRSSIARNGLSSVVNLS
jgi:hypothetical protein